MRQYVIATLEHNARALKVVSVGIGAWLRKPCTVTALPSFRCFKSFVSLSSPSHTILVKLAFIHLDFD
jgi:hypothetical protein